MDSRDPPRLHVRLGGWQVPADHFQAVCPVLEGDEACAGGGKLHLAHQEPGTGNHRARWPDGATSHPRSVRSKSKLMQPKEWDAHGPNGRADTPLARADYIKMKALEGGVIRAACRQAKAAIVRQVVLCRHVRPGFQGRPKRQEPLTRGREEVKAPFP